MSRTLLLVGAGGHAQSCIDVIERAGQYEIAGLVGSKVELGRDLLGYKVLGTDDDLPRLSKEIPNALVAVGQVRSPAVRVTLFERLQQLGFVLPPIISAEAIVSRHASVGEGTVVMHGAIINAGAKVGANVIVNSRALIEHGGRIGDHCHISTGAIINGDAMVKERCFIGSGSVVREGIEVGCGCIVGMGLFLRHSLPDNTKYTGRGALG